MTDFLDQTVFQIRFCTEWQKGHGRSIYSLKCHRHPNTFIILCNFEDCINVVFQKIWLESASSQNLVFCEACGYLIQNCPNFCTVYIFYFFWDTLKIGINPKTFFPHTQSTMSRNFEAEIIIFNTVSKSYLILPNPQYKHAMEIFFFLLYPLKLPSCQPSLAILDLKL